MNARPISRQRSVMRPAPAAGRAGARTVSSRVCSCVATAAFLRFLHKPDRSAFEIRHPASDPLVGIAWVLKPLRAVGSEKRRRLAGPDLLREELAEEWAEGDAAVRDGEEEPGH